MSIFKKNARRIKEELEHQQNLEKVLAEMDGISHEEWLKKQDPDKNRKIAISMSALSVGMVTFFYFEIFGFSILSVILYLIFFIFCIYRLIELNNYLKKKTL